MVVVSLHPPCIEEHVIFSDQDIPYTSDIAAYKWQISTLEWHWQEELSQPTER